MGNGEHSFRKHVRKGTIKVSKGGTWNAEKRNTLWKNETVRKGKNFSDLYLNNLGLEMNL